MEDNGNAAIEPESGETATAFSRILSTVQRRERIYIVELLRRRRAAALVVQRGTGFVQ